jgi:hypothetical protein
MPDAKHDLLPPILKALHEYWVSKQSGANLIPSRADISPLEVPHLLSRIILLELVDGRLRYRLAGTQVCETYGFDPTGKFLDEMLSRDHLSIADRACREALGTGRAVMARASFRSARGHKIVVTRLVMPLRDAHGTVSMLLAGLEVEPGRVNFKESAGPNAAIRLAPDEITVL